jgi:hypothetical protein
VDPTYSTTEQAFTEVKMGAAFSLIMQQALRLLHLIGRLAEQLLAAASRLFRRGDDAASSTADVTESRVDRMVPPDRTGKVNKAERADVKRRAERPRPSAGQPARAPQASRRQCPRPAARDAEGAPRRSAVDRPVRAARND